MFKGKQFENQFFIYEPKCKNIMYILGYFGLPWTGPILLSSYPHPYLCTCQIRKQYDKKFLSLNSKYEKYTFFSYVGGSWGPLRQTQVNENFRAVRPHQSRHMYYKGKNNHQFFIYVPQYTKICIFVYSGGPWVAQNNSTGPIPAILPSISIYMEAIQYGFVKLSRKRWNADAAA